MKCFVFFGLLWLSLSMRAQQAHHLSAAVQKRFDSLQLAYKTAKTDTSRLKTLIYTADEYVSNADYRQGLQYAHRIQQLSDKLIQSPERNVATQGRNGGARALLCIGHIYFKRANFKLALNYYSRAVHIFTEVSNQAMVSKAYSDMASAYSGLGNFNESLQYSVMSIKIDELLKDERGISVELNNIGSTYSDLNNEGKAREYHLKALAIALKLGDKGDIATYTGNVGSTYQKQCDSAFEAGNNALSLKLEAIALTYYNKSLNMREEIGDKEGTAIALENIGIVYSNDEHDREALPYLLKALAIYKELNLKAEEAFSLFLVGSSYQAVGQNDKAEACLKRSIELAKETGSPYSLMDAYKGSSAFYEKTKRPGLALDYYKQFIANRDSIYNREQTDAFTRTELNYEFEKKQAEVKFQNDKIIYQLEAGNKLHRRTRVFLMVGILLSLVLLFFAKRAYDNKKKYAEWLSKEDSRKELLLREVHHRINNNLQIISGLLTLQANSVDDPKLHEYLAQSQNRIQSLSSLHELLYDTNSPMEIDMHDYIDKVLGFHRDVAGTHPASIVIEAHVDHVRFPTRLAIPLALIVNELVTNSLKYGFADTSSPGTITVALSQAGEDWQLLVRDTGKGMPEESLRRKNSLGLKLVNILTRQVGGRLETRNEGGALFSVLFRLNRKAAA